MIEILLEDNLGILEKVQALLEYRKVILEHLKLNENFFNYKKKILKLKLTQSGRMQYSVVIKRGKLDERVHLYSTAVCTITSSY